MIRILFFLISTLTVIAGRAVAVEVPDLYEYQQSVDDKTRQTRLTASKNALLNVVTKITGDTQVNHNSTVLSALGNISDYMLKFEYDEKRDGSLFLVVRFEANKVNQLIKDSGLPIWGNRRPLVAVWLAIEDSWRRELVTQDSYPQIEQIIYDKAKRRGVPVVVPLLDLEDRAKVGVAEVWGNFSQQIEAASSRYNAERSITARMYQNNETGAWQLDWRFSRDDSPEYESLIGDRQQIVAELIDALARRLADEYAVTQRNGAQQDRLKLTLRDLNDFVATEQARRQLTSLSVVAEAEIVERTPEFVVYSLMHTGTFADLEKALQLDSHFETYVDPDSLFPGADKSRFVYRWKP